MDSLRRMSNGRFRHMPIIDEKDNVKGMISQGDFVAVTWSQLFSKFKQLSKASFLSYTQLWMLVIGILAYITLVMVLT